MHPEDFGESGTIDCQHVTSSDSTTPSTASSNDFQKKILNLNGMSRFVDEDEDDEEEGEGGLIFQKGSGKRMGMVSSLCNPTTTGCSSFESMPRSEPRMVSCSVSAPFYTCNSDSEDNSGLLCYFCESDLDGIRLICPSCNFNHEGDGKYIVMLKNGEPLINSSFFKKFQEGEGNNSGQARKQSVKRGEVLSSDNERGRINDALSGSKYFASGSTPGECSDSLHNRDGNRGQELLFELDLE
eukprot:Nk52_evm111s226 gene=Nk52_evmTU111s226